MPSTPVFHQDPYRPVLTNSESLDVSPEQDRLIRDVLDLGASDSRFATKMYDAIRYILTTPSVALPEVESINPTSAVLGSPNFDIHVTGKGFESGSTILWNGGEEPTTFVSNTELKTGVDMSTAITATTLPVSVQNSNGLISNTVEFEFLAAGELSRSDRLKNQEKELREQEKRDRKDTRPSDPVKTPPMGENKPHASSPDVRVKEEGKVQSGKGEPPQEPYRKADM